MVSAAAASGREVLNPRSWRSRAGAIVLAALSAAAVSACGSRAGAPSPLARVQGATIHPSLATSIETSAGSWVTVPMGHLDQPLNTFWQLFFRPRGARQWSNTASALAVATNGGLVLATDAGKSLTIGIRPTNYLAYSPLIVTSNARSWSSATPLGALAEQPDALAVTAGGAALALVAGARTDEVSASSAGLAGWRTLVTAAELLGLPARSCLWGRLDHGRGLFGHPGASRGELRPARCRRRVQRATGKLAPGQFAARWTTAFFLARPLGLPRARTASDVDRALRACQPCPRRRRRTCRCLHSGRHAELAGFPSAARTQRRRRDLLRPDRREWTFRPDLGSGSPAHTCGAACSGYGMGHLGLSAARNRHRRVRPRGQR